MIWDGDSLLAFFSSMGKKAWLFCWTELGAKLVGIAQSLLTTCRLHGTFIVDQNVEVIFAGSNVFVQGPDAFHGDEISADGDTLP